MEKWNLYLQDGTLTDKIHMRGVPVPQGFYHLVIHVWLMDENGRYLIQRRASTVESYPGIWAATGGSAIAGETSLEAVRRETMEELGLNISPKDFRLTKRFLRSDHLLDLWQTTIHSGFDEIFIPTEEVDEVAFRYPQEIVKMLRKGDFFPYWDEYFRTLRIEV